MADPRVIRKNDTDTNVTFGMYNGYQDHSKEVKVKANGASDDKKVDYPGVRVVAAWTSGKLLYPTNDAGKRANAYFQPDSTYTVMLPVDGLGCSNPASSKG